MLLRNRRRAFLATLLENRPQHVVGTGTTVLLHPERRGNGHLSRRCPRYLEAPRLARSVRSSGAGRRRVCRMQGGDLRINPRALRSRLANQAIADMLVDRASSPFSWSGAMPG